MFDTPADDFSNRRLSTDRRHCPTRLFNRHFLRGNRCGSRRASEDTPGYVDRPGVVWILLAVVVLVAGIVDAWLTHFGLVHKLTTEANPVMRVLYSRIGPSLTWSIKIGLTILGAWLLLAHRRWPLATLGLILLTVYYLTIFAMHIAGLGIAIISL